MPITRQRMTVLTLICRYCGATRRIIEGEELPRYCPGCRNKGWLEKPARVAKKPKAD